MPLWGITDTNTNGSKPKYLNTANAQNAFATDQGWVLRHGGTYVDCHGNTRTKDEILIPIRQLDLAAKLAAATITAIQFASSTASGNTSVNVIVTYNERVQVVGNPTFTITAANTTAATVVTPVTATYASGNNTNRLTFAFTTDANAAIYTLGAATIANTQALQIVDVGNTSVASDLTIPEYFTGSNSAIGTLTVS